ncbi:hypothetical protein N7489_008528 [Penicillium chrysogenum]|uniref:uncharacterized protein n=1 Tax=Penicillium chrysogenum TaxID=5076 RepID=UPI0023870EFB|nr:uncharacterized protein N7489_008528 [Penicillium chrysogenum]KAJ5227820.1 hypothetical protein N7489_008528 [Penicillium chrysogenum]KAJ5286454.1 hypothetical protein N7524_001760 [Penicillium chrysogenum]KAJ6167322.1 hypothetical protein N7497_000165 [Penicillium chrysogenum]
MQKEEGKMAIPAPIIELPQTPKLTNLMTTFCSPSSTPKIMQDTIHTLTHEIISAAKSHDQTLQPPTTMIPTLRGALTHPLLPATSCILARCNKTKGTQDVVVDWLGRRPFPPASDDGKIVILDTIIATGIQLSSFVSGSLSGVGVRGEGVSNSVYEWGEGKTKEPVVAEGEDVRSVFSGVQSLLVDNGGLWKLTEDGLAIEREIHFPGFKEAWAYNKVSIRWATHHPKGSTSLDVVAAQLCDSYV